MAMKWLERSSKAGSILSSLLACAACPLCLPVYAALLSAVGLELSTLNAYFYPLMLVFFGITLFFMYRQSERNHTSKMPFLLGSTAGWATIISATYGYEWALYGSLLIFVFSSFWNKRMISRHSQSGCCEG